MHEIHYSDITLLQRIADGEEAAFIQFFRTTSPVIYADLMIVMQQDKAAVMEALQETYVKLWLYRDKLPHIKQPDTHIRTVALKEAYLYLYETAPREPLPVHHEDEDFIPRHHYQEYQALIHEVIISLPPQRRLIYEMHRLQGMKIADIGKSLGLSDDAVHSAIHAVQQSVRQCVRELAIHDESSAQHQWVAAGVKELEEHPPVPAVFNERWLPLASRAMAVDRPTPADSSPVVRKVYSRRLNTWYALAALIFLLLGPGIYLLIMRANSRRAELLPDQTKVWLNEGATVSWDDDFSATARNLTVEGEACFQATKDTTLPFYIEADSLQLIVQGTYFDVRTGTGNVQIIPLGHSGATVSYDSTTKAVTAGQQAIISSRKTLQIEPADVKEIMSWKK
ncbi:sigma factor-like helix-turn-helix DNA-binding protein [Chitinophaga tropicalis]|uniref:Uncharacterized protein n=1 Tax=Chitinophaga tropicalis TaxID=2683588 RepID=A0A7K1U880_9BACT|nr:sigma factor-like helix-turn-helix DNA-binding protein [Chitinophaga tropicalis]MVT10583.1 hypothetical protein [Chitinophaga tropicalis]